MEKNKELGEESLQLLDSDPLYLFGIVDATTQKILRQTLTVPMLHSIGSEPVLEEWFAYLNADPEKDKDYTWIVESLSRVEIPEPWTSFKGTGNIIYFLHGETQGHT